MTFSFVRFALLLVCVLCVAGCKELKRAFLGSAEPPGTPPLEERMRSYAATDIRTDLSRFSTTDTACLHRLIEAARLADEIFWQQTSPDAIAVRDSLNSLTDASGQHLARYARINYGPYDRIYGGIRFFGEGPDTKPPMSNFYPQDLTREEFDAYVSAHPERKEELEHPTTIVRREGTELMAIPYHTAYPQVKALAKKLEEAAALTTNPSLKKYLTLRAKAITTDDYYESDLAWMDLRDHAFDIIIGPIENYEDALFNYKTAYEAAVLIRNEAVTRELQLFRSHIDGFEHALPLDAQYIRKSAGTGNILEAMDVVYFAGDFQKGVKTIAASLPNDPRVTQDRGGKKQMFINLMQAKFEKIVQPIGETILDDPLVAFVDKDAFVRFVTLHEISHTLGRAYVFGHDSLSVRRALKDRYSAIEECKADVLGLYNMKYLVRKGVVPADAMKKSMITYVVGLYRSLRFGAEEAHGKANLVQLNFLRESGAIRLLANGKISIDEKSFLDRLTELARRVLMIEITGDYAGAGTLLKRYGVMTKEIATIVENVRTVPRDLDTSYSF